MRVPLQEEREPTRRLVRTWWHTVGYQGIGQLA